ncbi:NAD-dependent epimerase/dehydratase family protein [Staphylococcus durrellii]|uniref:NAD-dependent epimerase/dehydratase family protein n=1 Tax=Staphylococcus durrellii TaxID=2781773 RepID=UPI00189FCC4D|nr:NAD-dependent epimerase/dehydratase family protein [Staphylococcus durrellii]MBF7017994.1 NAD-dependent epimerase/dehydratase family protein [Staphylococcus durrellii]
MKKRILITGTSGYISNNLTNKITGEFHDVERISMRNNAWMEYNLENYDVIIHAAALVHNNEPSARLSDYLHINMKKTLLLAEKAKQEGVPHFIFMSTMSVYGKEGQVGKPDIINKQSPMKPTTDYGLSKLIAEEKLMEMETEAFKVAVVRPPMIYGSKCPGNFKKLCKVAKKLPILPYIENQRSALYIEHFNDFIEQMINKQARGTFHPQDDYYFETTKVMHEIRKQLHKKTMVIKVPSFVYPILNRLSLFKKLFGNLTYNSQMDMNTTSLEISQQRFASVMEEIMDYKNQK